jgi:hypothetical protein
MVFQADKADTANHSDHTRELRDSVSAPSKRVALPLVTVERHCHALETGHLLVTQTSIVNHCGNIPISFDAGSSFNG